MTLQHLKKMVKKAIPRTTRDSTIPANPVPTPEPTVSEESKGKKPDYTSEWQSKLIEENWFSFYCRYLDSKDSYGTFTPILSSPEEKVINEIKSMCVLFILPKRATAHD